MGEESFLRQEISSANSFLFVAIHSEFMPNGESMSKQQKKCASMHPIMDDLQLWTVQLSAAVLSVTFSKTGCGSSLTRPVVTTFNAAQ